MTSTIQIHASQEASGRAIDDPAVARCVRAWEVAFQKEMAGSDNRLRATRNAINAFHNAMPPLSGYENIRDFIACVAHGMLTNVIIESSGTKLLYAAQVALALVRKQPAQSKPASS